MRASLIGQSLLLGVDRLDPAKGLAERLEAFGRLLERKPEWRGRASMLQIAAASRQDVASYRHLRREIEAIAGRINAQYGEPDWTPVRLVTRAVKRDTVAGYMRMARVCMVTSLRDGMNVVAKEFVAAQDAADPGVLVLSRFAGAAEQLKDAVLVNPNDPEALTDVFDAALRMDLSARKQRWVKLWHCLQLRSAHDWGVEFLAALEEAGAERKGSAPQERHEEAGTWRAGAPSWTADQRAGFAAPALTAAKGAAPAGRGAARAGSGERERHRVGVGRSSVR